jgi:glycosyltransferase involved in cell wall biosynthesis
MKPAEVILVDDKSDDDTLAVLQVLRQRYGADWIKILSSKRNGGSSIARNIGWEQSTHNYVAFLDADDVWLPQKIEIQYTWMQDHQEVALSGHKCVMLNPGMQPPFINTERHFAARYLSRRRLLISNPFVTPSFMLKRDLQYRFDPSSRYAEDFFLLLQLGLGGYTIAMLDVELVYVFKQFGVSGISGNIFKMRSGDLKNYWRLWQLGQLNFAAMSVLMMYSSVKLFMLLLLGPKRYENLNRWLNKSQRRI